MKKTIAVIILTYNAEQFIDRQLKSILHQTLHPNYIVVIDSASSDNTVNKAKKYKNVIIKTIKKDDFNHGKTRKLGTELVNADYYVFLTQDALPANSNTIINIITFIESDDAIGCAYGRQLPAKNATPIANHARIFNYPIQSKITTFADKEKLGIKTCFCSDSFAVYRKKALQIIGGFPEKIIFGEDMYVAAKMLIADWKVGYAANACVFHSHNLSCIQEFKRYYKIGVFHKQNKWLLETFKSPTREGVRFIKSELSYLIKNRYYNYFPKFAINTFAKYIGYKLGRY